jgi:hypothetical protein
MFKKLKDKCTKGYVFRKDLWNFTGGIIKNKTMATFDSQGRGIEEKYIVGNKTVYPIDSVIAWLENNTKRIK